MFPPEGEIALMFLKSYTGQSDDGLVEMLNGNLRATVMEGSFGNQKLHYGVGRIAARNSRSETLLLFFGIHMANAAILAHRKWLAEEKEKEKARRSHKRA